MTEIKWRTDKEYLKKLAALADVSFYEGNWAKKNGDLEAYHDCLVRAQAILGYFARLTLKALEDWELGEELIEIYDEIKSEKFYGFLSGLERTLLEQHAPRKRLVEREIESRIRKLENSGALDMAPKYRNKWLKSKKNKARSPADEGNKMFA